VYIVGLYIIFGLFKVVLTAIGFLSSLLERAKFAGLEKKKLVIVGGGYAGTYAAVKLQNHFDTTLIDTKSYFEFTPRYIPVSFQCNYSSPLLLLIILFFKLDAHLTFYLTFNM
jgi:hypothetical protein